MDDERRAQVDELTRAADDLAGLAETAELMRDEGNAVRFRAEAARQRLRAMALLDE